MKEQLFVTGIGTEIGKTVIAAILTEALKADYWKPVQAGDLDNSDTHKVLKWTSNTKAHPETHRLNTPMSPHAAAAIDGIEISLSDFQLPQTSNKLIVEGAGGLMVPLNDKDCILDLIAQLKIAVVLVSRHYLGSINHTLLSVAMLKNRNIPIKGIIFNGDEHPTTESIIKKMTQVPILGRIPELKEINKQTIRANAVFLDL